VLKVKAEASRNALEVANILYESGNVAYAHPNFYVRTVKRTLPNQPFIPDDTLFDDQWHLNNTGQGGGTADADVDAPEAWDYARGNSGVIIAVLDDGIQVNHPDLTPNVLPGGRDFTANPPDNDPSPGTYDHHGTLVTGVAAARGNNDLGVSGSCMECGILAIRMLGGTYADHADAFDYAAAQNASIITNSWGYDIGTPTTDDVVDAINDAATNGRGGLGAVIFFAMTNTNTDNCSGTTPDISSLDNVIAVSRSTNQDLLGNAGFGTCMDLIAPTRGGTLGITTTDRTGADGKDNSDYYDDFGGTSSATPLTAGIAGLLLDLNPNLTRLQVQGILEHTAEKIDATNAHYDGNGFSNTHGYGRVNAHRAVVPTVKISVSPKQVRRNEPFTVKVSASAPYGLKSVWWFGQGTGIPDIDRAHWHDVSGSDPVYVYEWTDVRIGSKGTYTLGSNARDVRYPTPGDGYPHQASEGSGIAYTQIKVVPAFQFWATLLLGLTLVMIYAYRLKRQ
jgi:subtilisin family serine protease